MAQIHINEKNSVLWTYPNYGPDLFDYLNSLTLEHNPKVKFGLQRRDVGFFSNSSEGYQYSGQLMVSQPLPPFLATFLEAINKSLGTSFNGILINRYNDGNDYIGSHSDSESGLDQNHKMIASIAYGAVRKFRIRDKQTKKIKYNLDHQSGMLLVMQGDFQKHFNHEIPPQKKITGVRISITFRQHNK